MQPTLTAYFVDGANASSVKSIIRFVAAGPGTAVDADDLQRLLSAILETPCIFAHPAPSWLADLAKGAPVDGLRAIAAVAVLLQRQIGYDVTHYGQSDGQGLKGHWWFECVERSIALTALRLARQLVGLAPARPDRAELLATVAGRLDDLFDRIDLYSWFVWRAAQRQDIPCRYLLSGALIYELGLGARTHRATKGMFDPESWISYTLGSNKNWTSKLLHDAGIRVPRQRRARSFEGARKAAADLGYPVVVKPATGGGQRGVSLNVRSEAELKDACARAAPRSRDLLVETYVPGRSYRLTAVNGRLVNAFELEPPHITGNGRDSIGDLVAEENRSPLRGKGKRFAYPPIDLAAIESKGKTPYGDLGLTADSVPEEGQRLDLCYFGGGAHGGMTIEVTDKVHPDYERILRRVHATIPIPVCGFDLICPDVSAPPLEIGYAINEINSFPALTTCRLEGPESHSAVNLVNAITGGPEALRVPVVVIVTEQKATSLTATVAAALGSGGRSVAAASREGYFVDAVSWSDAFHANLEGMRRAMSDRQAEAIVVERFVAELGEAGLGLAAVDLVIFAPDTDGDVARFLERTAYLQGVSRRGNVFVDVPPGQLPAGRQNVSVSSSDAAALSAAVQQRLVAKAGG
ncbi:ATP-grasp domain-containing protein [Pelagibius marinus]|uniref:ATP-binding protein n=1 Tax=Pelagibius marinus TaxID=2762760 RepID=UPI00187279D6|nr:ATP-grasp domain-containing protein [Pelagibius marinus]